VPALQLEAEHALWPAKALVVPAGQEVHEAAPPAAAILPAAQAEQD